jgi:type I restriction enzyme S subunit
MTSGDDDTNQISVGEVADLLSGPAFPSAAFLSEGEGIRLLRGDNIEPGSVRWRRTRTWPEAKLDGFEHLLLAEGDLVLAMDRPLIAAGLKLARVTSDDVPALLVQRVARLRCRPEVLPQYLHLVLATPQFRAHLRRHEVGTHLPHITLAAIRAFAFPMPSLSNQRRVVDSLEALLGSRSRLVRELGVSKTRSTSLRRTLLMTTLGGGFSAVVHGGKPVATIERPQAPGGADD